MVSILLLIIGIGVTGGTIIGSYFGYLVFLGLITVNSYSGDMACDGTIENPCIADIDFCVNKVYGKVNDIFFYPTDYDPWGRNTSFEFEPNLKDWKFQRKWGSSFRTYDLTKPCRSSWCGYGSKSPDSKFSLAFREGKCYQVRLVGYKNNPSDVIKWSAFDGEIDHYWLAKEVGDKVVKELCNPVYATWTEEIKHNKNCTSCYNITLYSNETAKEAILYPNGSYYVAKEICYDNTCPDYTEYIPHINETIRCDLNGEVQVDDVIYKLKDSFCRLEDTKIRCYSDEDNGRFAITWRKDDSVNVVEYDLLTGEITAKGEPIFKTEAIQELTTVSLSEI